MWKKQTKIGFDKNVLVVADTSASMRGTPFETAISLAIYISQNNKSEQWRNRFMIFLVIVSYILMIKIVNYRYYRWNSYNNDKY